MKPGAAVGFTQHMNLCPGTCECLILIVLCDSFSNKSNKIFLWPGFLIPISSNNCKLSGQSDFI